MLIEHLYFRYDCLHCGNAMCIKLPVEVIEDGIMLQCPNCLSKEFEEEEISAEEYEVAGTAPEPVDSKMQELAFQVLVDRHATLDTSEKSYLL